MAKEIIKVDEETGIVKKRTRFFMQGGHAIYPSAFPLLMGLGAFVGLFPGLALADSLIEVLSIMGVGAIAGFGTAKTLMIVDFVDDIGDDVKADFKLTIPQLLTTAAFLPVKVQGVNRRFGRPKYLNELTESDEYRIKQEKTDYAIGAEHRVELKIRPLHFTINQEWEKTELGLWDDVMDNTLRNGSYAIGKETEAKNAKQLLSSVPVQMPETLKEL